MTDEPEGLLLWLDDDGAMINTDFWACSTTRHWPTWAGFEIFATSTGSRSPLK
ncbi:hypothetical protein [Rhizobium nepotum]|uniref:hypothetical protein n=1 Tax=Rhizobium nepotum TaxID=1035271 RepID=UPI003CED6ABE